MSLSSAGPHSITPTHLASLPSPRLSVNYKDMSLNQRAGKTFAKKNIGRLVEEKLDQYLQQPRESKEYVLWLLHVLGQRLIV